jgi:hypothetical protein
VGNAVYSGTSRNRRSEVKVFLEFTEGEDDFYASTAINNLLFEHVKIGSRARREKS